MSSVIKYRSFDDFKWGSFEAYVTKEDVFIYGILKKTNSRSKYMRVKG